MKRKIRIIDNLEGKREVVEFYVNERDPLYLQTQLKYKPKIYTPKKGKGSFKRTKKVDY